MSVYRLAATTQPSAVLVLLSDGKNDVVASPGASNSRSTLRLLLYKVTYSRWIVLATTDQSIEVKSANSAADR